MRRSLGDGKPGRVLQIQELKRTVHLETQGGRETLDEYLKEHGGEARCIRALNLVEGHNGSGRVWGDTVTGSSQKYTRRQEAARAALLEEWEPGGSSH